jgi:integrase
LRNQDSVAARALEFTILTAARRQEVLLATQEEVDIPAKLWTVPPERMKGRRKHFVPLSNRALELVREVAGEKYLFPSDNNEAGLSIDAMLKLLVRMDYGHVTVHGFRSSFKTWAVEQTSFENHVSESALAHQSGDAVERAYRRSDFLEKRRKLMDMWADYCAGKKAKGGNVTQLYA